MNLQQWMKKEEVFDRDLYRVLSTTYKIKDPFEDFSSMSKKDYQQFSKKAIIEKKMEVKDLKTINRLEKKLAKIKKHWKQYQGKRKKNTAKVVYDNDEEQSNNNNNNNNNNSVTVDITNTNKGGKKTKKVKTKKKKNKKKKTKNSDNNNNSAADSNNDNNNAVFVGLSPLHTRIIIDAWFRAEFNQLEAGHKKVERKLFFIIAKYCPIFGAGSNGTLIVKANKTHCLRSDVIHDFEKIILKKNAILTVDKFVTKTKKQNPKLTFDGEGGFLYLCCASDIIMHEGSKITVKGRGYPGGYGKGIIGGDGMGLGGGALGEWMSGKGAKYGGVYGDEQLSTLHLGSGGGGHASAGNRFFSGGHGGGVLKIQCCRLIMKAKAKIVASGASSVNGAGGSGGSLWIRCMALQMKDGAKISNVGGKGDGDPYSEGTEHGGHGRIRIDSFREAMVAIKNEENINCDFKYFSILE